MVEQCFAGAEAGQRLLGAATISGIGLHTGEPVTVEIRPMPPGTGYVFEIRQNDSGARAGRIPADARLVTQTRLGTCLEQAGVSVRTVEHGLAALALLGIDDAALIVDGTELPILDGSALDYVTAIAAAGLAPADAPAPEFAVNMPVEIQDGESRLRLEPAETLSLDVSIAFPDTAIGSDRFVGPLSAQTRSRIASARTFCARRDLDALRAAGLIKGGTLDNAIVVDGDGLLGETALRDPQEFVLHKTLDLIGDLALVGCRLRGRLVAERPGHALNTRFAALLRDQAGAAGMVG